MTYRILVVDDTKFMRKMLRDILEKYGHHVVGEAENGTVGIQKYKELKPDFIMMDISMPEIDGVEAVKRIKAYDPSAVVLICSAMSQQDQISEALKAGAVGYILKPFKPEKVNEVIFKYASEYVERNRKQAAFAAVQHAGAVTSVNHAQTAVDLSRLEVGPDKGKIKTFLPRFLEKEEEERKRKAEEERKEEEERKRKEEEERKRKEEEERKRKEEEERKRKEEEERKRKEEEERKRKEEEERKRKEEEERKRKEEEERKRKEEEERKRKEEEERKRKEEEERKRKEEEERKRKEEEERMRKEEEERKRKEEEERKRKEEEERKRKEEEELKRKEEERKRKEEEERMRKEEERKRKEEEERMRKEEEERKHKENEQADTRETYVETGGSRMNMKGFTITYVCNWEEEVKGESRNYKATCFHSDRRLEIEWSDQNQHRQSIEMTVEGFRQLANWVQDVLKQSGMKDEQS